MVDSSEWVRERLHTGEDGQTEFKEVRFGKRGVTDPSAESFAAELVAFSNANEYDLFGQQLRLTMWARPDRDT